LACKEVLPLFQTEGESLSVCWLLVSRQHRHDRHRRKMNVTGQTMETKDESLPTNYLSAEVERRWNAHIQIYCDAGSANMV